MKRNLLILIGLLSAIYVHTQEIEDSKIYYEFKNEDVDISLKKGEPVITHFINEKKFYNVIPEPSMNVEYIFERSFSEISDIKARYGEPLSYNAEKFSVHYSNDIIKQSYFEQGVFYGDNYYYEVNYPGLTKGCFTEIEYILELKDPHFLKDFCFTDIYPVKKSVYTLNVDEDVEIGWSVYGDQKGQIEFTEEKGKKGLKIYKWKLENVKPYKDEKNNPGFFHSATHVIVYVKKYINKDDQVIPVLSSTADLYNWYQTFIDRIEPVDDSILNELTLNIVKDAENEFDKARLIFNWVQDNIRYIAIEDGWRGFIPYPASEVCVKKYGDCKDMSNLLFSMLKIAGVKAEHAWVGTRSRPYNYQELPDPIVDNHMVIIVNIDDSTFILDATDPHIPFGWPTAFILSKQVLYKSNEGNYQIYYVPEFKAADCIISDSIRVAIDGNALKGNANRKMESFAYSDFQNVYNSNLSDKRGQLEKYLKLGSEKFDLTDWQIKTINPRSKVAILYEFNIRGYVKSYGSSQFVNLNLTRPFFDQKLEENRQQNYEIRYKRKYIDHVTLELPENKKVSELPEKIDLTFDVGSIKAEYVQEGNLIHYKRTITIDRLMIKSNEFGEWNEFIKTLLRTYNLGLEIL